MFKPATKKKSKAKIALVGPAGSGKTYTALRMAQTLAQGGRVAVFDTERGSASKYVDDAQADGVFAFDVYDEMPDFSVKEYLNAIQAAVVGGYKVLVFDSLSPAWSGKGGILEFVDSQSGPNKFAGWKAGTPMHNRLIDGILSAPLHIIVTIRTKTEYAQNVNEKTNKIEIKRLGSAPVQRDGLEYEFDIIFDMDAASMTASKTRCSALAGRRFTEPGADVANIILDWLQLGEEVPPKVRPIDPHWDEETDPFDNACVKAGFTYERIAAFCEAKMGYRPPQMTTKQRATVISRLETPEFGEKVLAFEEGK